MNWIQLSFRIWIILISLLLITSATQAFVITTLQINIKPDGSAQVDAQYNLNGTERIQYDLITRLINPVPIGEDQIGKLLNRSVTIQSITPEYTRLTIVNLTLQKGNHMITPGFKFLKTIEQVEKNLLWVLDRFDISLVPNQTTITFPDGYTEIFMDCPEIPPIYHMTASPASQEQ